MGGKSKSVAVIWRPSAIRCSGPQSPCKIEGETYITSFTISVRHVLDEAYNLDDCERRKEERNMMNERTERKQKGGSRISPVTKR